MTVLVEFFSEPDFQGELLAPWFFLRAAPWRYGLVGFKDFGGDALDHFRASSVRATAWDGDDANVYTFGPLEFSGCNLSLNIRQGWTSYWSNAGRAAHILNSAVVIVRHINREILIPLAVEEGPFEGSGLMRDIFAAVQRTAPFATLGRSFMHAYVSFAPEYDWRKAFFHVSISQIGYVEDELCSGGIEYGIDFFADAKGQLQANVNYVGAGAWCQPGGNKGRWQGYLDARAHDAVSSINDVLQRFVRGPQIPQDGRIHDAYLLPGAVPDFAKSGETFRYDHFSRDEYGVAHMGGFMNPVTLCLVLSDKMKIPGVDFRALRVFRKWSDG